MATKVNEFSFDFSGVQASGVFLEPIFMDENTPFENFKLMQNIKHGKSKIHVVGRMSNILQKKDGCGVPAKGSLDIYDRDITTELVAFHLKFCYDELKNTYPEEILNTGVNKPNIEGTGIDTILLERAVDAAMKDMNDLFWFGDTSAVSNNIIDGIWSVHAPYLVGNDLAPYYNSGSGASLTSGQGIDILDAVWSNASNALKGWTRSELKFLVSGSVFEQLRRDYQTQGIQVDLSLQNTIGGMPQMFFMGIPVVPHYEWDEYQTGAGNPNTHLAVLTIPSYNLIVGTDMASDRTLVDSWYNRETEHFHVKGAFEFGANYLHGQLFSFAY